MLCGLPGAGKSTFIKRNYPEGNFVLLSTDRFIEDLAVKTGKTYNDLWKDNVKQAEVNMEQMLQFALKEEMNIIWDQTNLTVKTRKQKLAKLPDVYEKHCAVFLPNHQIIMETNTLRQTFGRALPEHVIQNMEKMFQMPTEDEGFSKIFYVQRT
jgi:predicted kinase